MNKKEAIEALECLYLEATKDSGDDPADKIEYSYQVLDNIIEELELYKAFVNEFKFEIVEEYFNAPDDKWGVDYLSQGGATDKAIELFKQIQELGGKQE